MTAHSFSTAQAGHAREVVLRLMRERRFFLHQKGPSESNENPGYNLDPDVFGSALELDQNLRTLYAGTAKRAEKVILRRERQLGVSEPDLGDIRRVVQCNRYTGGLDICSVWPISAFAPFVPDSLAALKDELIRDLQKGLEVDGYSPRELREIAERAEKVAGLIWDQCRILEIQDPDNHRCVILLKTRFNPDSGYRTDDFMEGRLKDMQAFPFAIGYLFWKYSRQCRVVSHSYIVSSTSRRSHVRIEHWRTTTPKISFNVPDGYDARVHFVTVL